MTSVTSKPFGKTSEGLNATLYIMTNSKGSKVCITDFGASVVSIRVPDKNGNFDDVVLGYDDVKGYESRANFFGATIGRCANRIGKSEYILNGKTYKVAANDGRNCLHGGIKGFDTKIWDVKIPKNDDGEYLTFHLMSPDGDENFPGNLDVNVTFTFNDKNELSLHYYAVSDKDTVCNLTNHTYFNLSGHNAGTILDHELKLYADNFTPADNESIPYGEVATVVGTPMDFRDFHKIGERIDNDFDQLKFGKGYDHNWVLNKGEKLHPCAEVYDEKSGRRMTVSTTLPDVQFYAGNCISGNPVGKEGTVYGKRSGLALETQFAPDSINKKNFTSPILKTGEEFDNTTIYRFDIKK